MGDCRSHPPKTESGTCGECGRSKTAVWTCRDERYGDEIDACAVCIKNEPELTPAREENHA